MVLKCKHVLAFIRNAWDIQKVHAPLKLQRVCLCTTFYKNHKYHRKLILAFIFINCIISLLPSLDK